ncbi:unnamed protein product [Ambrosiozyma monospora]|uniref:Unnamed protein product n=1 Tax=Ambrosiozyma monospora TaxID=43982 RepID=A0ACB5T6W8_AMBMO|nr:unnamed protein product [Ambrosiozyma monospora]
MSSSNSISEIPKSHKVIQLHENSESLDVIKYEDVAVPEIDDDDVLVKNKYAGVNFIEAYFRKGIYPSEKPCILGREASGVIAKVGKNVTNLKVGDHIAYISGNTFAQYTKYSSKSNFLKLDSNVTDEKLKLYAAALIQGVTALTFINESYNVQEGDYILVTAAAGGVGLILVQLISKLKKAHVIAQASTDEKLEIAKNGGAEYLLNSSKLSVEEQVAKILEITNGKGVQASFDSVGKDTAELSLAAIARKGTFVTFGNATGPIPPLALNRLSAKNLKVTRPQLFGFIVTPDEYQHYTSWLFKLIDDGTLNIKIFKTYPLSDYKLAAADLEGRKTSGKLVLEISQ